MSERDPPHAARFILGHELVVVEKTVHGDLSAPRSFWPGQKIIIRVTGVSIHGAAQRFVLYAHNVRFGS